MSDMTYFRIGVPNDMVADVMWCDEFDVRVESQMSCKHNDCSDPVKAPRHYAGDGITCKEAMRSMMGKDMAAYWWGCAFKYVWRWPHKNGVQDVDKAIECLTELRKLVE